MFNAHGEKIDIVEILLHPANTTTSFSRMEQTRQESQLLQDKELTMMPKTLQRTNQRLLQNKFSATGDHNLDLYITSKEHEKRNKDSEEYWYERNKEELTFKPQINAEAKRLEEGPKLNEIKGTDKQLERLAKARKEAEWKKMMTERSTFSATKGIKNARKQVNKKKDDPDFYIPPVETKKFNAGFGGVDGSQIIPPRNESILDNFNRDRPPLHLPKTSPEKKPKAIVPKKKSPSPVAPVAHHQPAEDDPKDLVDQQLNEMQDRIDERDPKLYVDVNIGKNGMERIVVYEGDTAESLADQFCEKHKLNKDMKEKLKVLLDQQIAGVLPKIMEDEDLDDSE